MANIHENVFNKNVIEVYTEEPGFTGYKGLEWNKLDNIEDILRQGVVISGLSQDAQTTNLILSGINLRTTSIDSKIYATGDEWPNGVKGTVVMQADLSQQFDAVTTFPHQSSLINNYAPSGLNGLILTSNPYRRELYIQNLSTGSLYVKYGLNANISSFSFVLAPNTSTNAGDGGSLSDQGYNGDVSVSGIEGVDSPKYISWERVSSKESLT